MPPLFRRLAAQPVLLLPLLLLILFWRSFDPTLTLCSGDASLSVIAQTYLLKPTLLSAPWSAFNGLGTPLQPLAIAPGFLLAWIVPFYKYVDANAIFHLFLLGLGGYLLLHDMTRHRGTAALGGIFLMLQPHVLSHLLPGHIGHFIMAGWTALSFYALRRTLLHADPLSATLTGLAFGLLIAAGQHDVAAFFGITLTAYGLFLLIRCFRKRTDRPPFPKLAGSLILAALLSLLIGAQAIFANLIEQVRHHWNVTANASTESEPTPSEREMWLWATQWSLPPVETLDAALPGLFGWGSASPENPYRGRIGQTEGWPEHQRGMPNLNDVCQYIGAVILLGAILAWRFRWRDPETWFFTAIALIALLLAWGKFGPLYRFFYALPGMNTLRNPIKWYYITSFACGVLGALGYSAALQRNAQTPSPFRSTLLWCVSPAAVILLAGAITLGAFWSDPFFLQTWRTPDAQAQFFLADLIRTQSLRALVLAALFWGAAGVSVFLLLRHPPSRPASRVGFALLGITLAAELLYVNFHYLPYQPWRPLVETGPFSDFLKSRAARPNRFRFLRQDGLFHHLREAAAVQGVENADPYPARLPDAFLKMQAALERTDPLKFWRLCNVQYVVSPQPLALNGLTPRLTLKAGDQTLVVHEYANTLPRAYRVPAWETLPESEALTRMANRLFDPTRKAFIHNPPQPLPSPVGTIANETGRCEILRAELHALTLETDGPSSGLVVVSSRYDPGWKATLNGRPAPLLKVNYMLQGVAVPAGRHTIELRYAPDRNRPALVAALSGWILTALLLLGIAGIRLWRSQCRSPRSPEG